MATVPARIDDRWPRLLLNPVFAVVVPLAAGLIDHAAYTSTGLALAYGWFLAMSVSVWETTRWLYFRRLDTNAWLSRPWKRVGDLGATIGLGTIPTITAGALLWAWASGDPAATWHAILTANVVTVAGVVVVVHVYETTFLLGDWESERLRAERLAREKITAELEALQREIDPHALFNMLNALAGLVEQGSPNAVRFAEALAHAYRRVLRVRREALITLGQELDLLDAFVTLYELRAPNAVQVECQYEGIEAARLPPMVLPELMANAFKHSAASAADPLVLTIRREGWTLVVSNRVRPSQPAEATGVGLRNMDTRCRLTTGRGIEAGRVGETFVVRVPLVLPPVSGRT